MTDMIFTCSFLMMGLALLGSALIVVLARSIVHSAISLIVTFFSVAALFFLLDADFLGVAQILVYGVGITILLLFAIMMTGKDWDKKHARATPGRVIISFVAAAALFCVVAFCLTSRQTTLSTPSDAFKTTTQALAPEQATVGSTERIGSALFSTYILPFEIVSLLLLAAMLAAVVIARKNDDNLVNPTTGNNP